MPHRKILHAKTIKIWQAGTKRSCMPQWRPSMPQIKRFPTLELKILHGTTKRSHMPQIKRSFMSPTKISHTTTKCPHITTKKIPHGTTEVLPATIKTPWKLQQRSHMLQLKILHATQGSHTPQIKRPHAATNTLHATAKRNSHATTKTISHAPTKWSYMPQMKRYPTCCNKVPTQNN